MGGRGDLVTLETTDPNCGGVVDSRNRRWDRKSAEDGRIEVPRKEAARILASGHPETRAHRPTFGGFYGADIWDETGHLRVAKPDSREERSS